MRNVYGSRVCCSRLRFRAARTYCVIGAGLCDEPIRRSFLSVNLSGTTADFRHSSQSMGRMAFYFCKEKLK